MVNGWDKMRPITRHLHSGCGVLYIETGVSLRLSIVSNARCAGGNAFVLDTNGGKGVGLVKDEAEKFQIWKIS
jgi:hypothetical protein